MAQINNIRIQHKHDIEENWNKAVNFIPKKGEIIVYDTNGDSGTVPRVKVGDGVHNVINLPFILEDKISNYDGWLQWLQQLKANKAETFTEGNLISFNEQGDLQDTGISWEHIETIDNAISDIYTKHYALEERFADPTEYGLPILKIYGDDSLLQKEEYTEMTYEYGDMSGTCEMKWQGSSSIRYPKKNFTIKFDQKFEAYEGWGEQKKYCLKANYMEHTHARNLVCAKLWGQIVKSRTVVNEKLNSLPNAGAVDGFPIVMYLNDIFHGLYTFNIPKDGWLFGMKEELEPIVIETNLLKYNIDETNQVQTYNFTDADQVDYEFSSISSTFTLKGTSMWDTTAANVVPYILIPINNTELVTNKTYHLQLTPIKNCDNAYISSAEIVFANASGGKTMAGNALRVGTTEEKFEEISFVNNIPTHLKINFPKRFRDADLDNDQNIVFKLSLLDPSANEQPESTETQAHALLCADYRSAATAFKGEAQMLEGVDFELEFNSDNFPEDNVRESLNNLINTCINVVDNKGLYVDANGNKQDGMEYLSQFVDWDSAIDYLIFTAAVGGVDIDRKNYILATYDGIKWFFSAYDMDTTFGVNWNGEEWYSGERSSVLISHYAKSHNLMGLIKKYKKEALTKRYKELMKGALSFDNVCNVFENFVSKISSGLYEEDIQRWPTIPSSEIHTVRQVLDWYKDRMKTVEKDFYAIEMDAPLTTDYIKDTDAYIYTNGIANTRDLDWYKKYNITQFGQYANYIYKLEKPIINVNIADTKKNASNAFFLQEFDSNEQIRINSKINVYEPYSHKECISIVTPQTIEAQNGISCEVIDSQTVKLHCDGRFDTQTAFLIELANPENILKNEIYDITTEVIEGTIPGQLTINIANAEGTKVHGGSGAAGASTGSTKQLTFGNMTPSHLKIITQTSGTVENLVLKISLKLATKNVLVIGDSITANNNNWLQKMCTKYANNLEGIKFIGTKPFLKANYLYLKTPQELEDVDGVNCEVVGEQMIKLNSEGGQVVPEFYIELDQSKFTKNTTYQINTEVVSGTVSGSIGFVLTAEIGGAKINGGYGTVSNSEGRSDTLTLGGTLPKYLKIYSASVAVSNIQNLKIKITITTSDLNKKDEATGGYTWDSYTRNPNTLPTPEIWQNNPFWLIDNHTEEDTLINSADIISYVNSNAGEGEKLDYLICILGMNSYVNHAFFTDVYGNNMDKALLSIRELCTHFVDTVLEAYPKCKILLGSYCLPPFIDGVNNRYWINLFPRADFIHRLNEIYQDIAGQYPNNVRFNHITSQIDNNHAYDLSTTIINDVEYTNIPDDIQVHTGEIGNKQMCEAMWRGFTGLVNM